MDPERYRNAFRANHSRLVRKLTSSELVGMVYSKDLITVSEKEEIEAEKTESSRVNKCLSIFHRRYYGDRNIFIKLFNVLEEINDDERGIIDHVISALNNSLNHPPEFPSSTMLLSEFDRERLRSNENAIATTLDVLQLLPDLISEGVVTFKDAEAFEEETSFGKRGHILVRLLNSKGSDVFECFIEVLRESEVYEQLARNLRGEGRTEMDDKKYVESVLKDGHVPPLPQNYVRRQELVKSIRKELRKLKDSDSWVVIYGLPGFGKTVLAADSVRQASLLREVFPGGVFWLSIGKMRDGSDEINMDALLEKVQNFIVRMDKNQYRPPNLESATDYLQTVMSEQHPRSLLVLDDLWELEAAQAFSVRCRTLVTTRNIDIAENVATNNIYKVSVTEGFTQEEGMMLLSKYAGPTIASLPPEANEIIKLSYGSPIVLDIIGASLLKTTSSTHWKVAVDRLKTQHPGGLVIKSSGMSPYLRTRRPSEQKRGRTKATLNTSISLTEESLPEDTREFFRWLVVFDDDTDIKLETLATIWEMPVYEAMDIMGEIVGWSLAKEGHIQSGNDDNDGLQSYTVHDMILDYLKDTTDPKTQQEYHKKLVERYSDKCNGDFSSIPSDGYIHKKLLSHVNSANMKEHLAFLLSDLPCLAAFVQYWDANSLLGAYKKYKLSLPEQNLPVVNEFQLFLSSNLNLLSTNPCLSDVVQLALTTLESDELVKQARREVEKDDKTMYLLWSNRNTARRPEATLKLQPHKNEVKFCQYYDKGTKVASCSADTVKLWVAATGEILESVCEHSNQITHCTITEDGSLLISSSEDTTCNVWDMTNRKLLLKFTEHFDGVQSCALSPDNTKVLSVDINSHTIVWSCAKDSLGDVIAKWDHGDTGLTSCTFLSTGKEVVVANQDGLVKLYSINGEDVATFPIPPVSLSFSQSGIVDLNSSRGPSRSSSNNGTGFTITSCVASRNGEMIAAGIGDCTARVWLIESVELFHTFPHSTEVLSVDFSPDSKLLLTGSSSGGIKVWSLSQGCPILDLVFHYDWVTSVKFSPSGSQILSSSDRIIKVIPLETGSQTWKSYKRRFSVHFKMNMERSGYIPTILCYDTKSKSLEVCEGVSANTVSVINTKSKCRPRSWCLSPDGKQAVVGYDEGVLQLFNIATGDIKWSQDNAHNGSIITHCYFSPDGTKIVSCGERHQVWSVESGERLSWQSDCQDYYVKPCVFYHDSNTLASTKKPGKILVWKANDQHDMFYCDNITDDVNLSILCVNISGDDSTLVASTGNGLVAVWNAQTGKKIYTGAYNGSSGDSQARYCSLDYNGILAAVGHDDCTLKIYNIKNGDEVTCPTNFSGAWMIRTQFSPDNKQILTLSNSIQWWSRDGKLLKQFILKSIFGKYLHFSPDFKTFITIDNTGLLYVLSVL